MTIAITGASGQLGRRAAELLLDAVAPGEVVLITRSPDGLADLAARGADVRHGDFGVPGSLPDAFAGVDRVLLISTDVVGQRVEGHRAAITAAATAGVRHIAYTSIPQPVADNPAAVVPDHAATEEALRDSGVGTDDQTQRECERARCDHCCLHSFVPPAKYPKSNGIAGCRFRCHIPCHWRIASTGQNSMITLSVRLSRIVHSVSSSSPIASATTARHQVRAGSVHARSGSGRDRRAEPPRLAYRALPRVRLSAHRITTVMATNTQDRIAAGVGSKLER